MTSRTFDELIYQDKTEKRESESVFTFASRKNGRENWADHGYTFKGACIGTAIRMAAMRVSDRDSLDEFQEKYNDVCEEWRKQGDMAEETIKAMLDFRII